VLGEMVGQRGRIADDRRDLRNLRRKLVASAASRSNAISRSGGQPARSNPRVRLPVPAPSSSTGPGWSRSTSRAMTAAK
jgi:hypothetical protein